MSLVPLPSEAPARTIPELITTSANRGDAPFLTARSTDGSDNVVSYEMLPETVSRAAGLLRRHGVERGSTVGIHLDNSCGFEAIILHFAAQWIGAVAVPVGTRLSPREVRWIVDDAGLSLLCTVSARHGAAVERALEGLVDPPRVLDLGDGLDALIRGGRSVEAADLTEHDLADILYTSGTSGKPKGVELEHGNCVACGTELVHAVAVRPDDVYQSAIPYFTSTGAHTNPLLCLAGGAHFVLEPEFDQHATIRRFSEHGTTMYFAVPAMYTLIGREADLSTVPSSLRQLVSGGSVLTEQIVKDLEQAFPGRGLVNLYGQTEAGPGGTVLGPDDTAAKPRTVGRRGNGPWTSFGVVTAQDRDAAVDEIGEIVLRSPAVMRGYHRQPEATAEALRGGWLHTGDLGYLDEEGYLHFVDRDKDLVVRGGFNISTSEVETVLRSHPAVWDAAVVGVEHDVLQEDLCAFVVAADDVSQEELVALSREQLADYKVPRQVVFLDDLPRNPMGKVLKHQLRDSDGKEQAGHARY